VNSFGFWLNRRTHRLLPIHDHAIDACANPARFGLTRADLARAFANAGRPCPRDARGNVRCADEDARAVIIPRVCSAGFIRIRYERRQATLGWQFAGDPPSALDRLAWFGRKFELGPAVLVNFGDFGMDAAVSERFGRILDAPAMADLQRRWWRSYGLAGWNGAAARTTPT
jgi:hypothetical protein